MPKSPWKDPMGSQLGLRIPTVGMSIRVLGLEKGPSLDPMGQRLQAALFKLLAPLGTNQGHIGPNLKHL